MQTPYKVNDHWFVKIGDVVTMDEPDRRWWRRAWFWLTRRGTPMRVVSYEAVMVNRSTIGLERR